MKSSTPRALPLVPLLFSLALGISAALLFALQPLIARMILPKFGGTPAVWNVCILFFQVGLLGGYAHAHVLASYSHRRRQLAIHLGVLLAPAVVLPFAVSEQWTPSPEAPVAALLGLLFVTVGLPYFALGASAPLFQRWYASSGQRGAADPYFLYAASNAGSLIGLLAYPLLIEPNLGLSSQSKWWAIGYAAFVVVAGACMIVVLRHREATLAVQPASPAPASTPRWRWLVLAAVPSSLLLGVTDQIAHELPPAPLIWLPPLALYLVSFIAAFSRLPPRFWTIVRWLTPGLILAQGMVTLVPTFESMPGRVALLLAAFFSIALMCHGELARLRPDSSRMTEYYLILTLGGALGGLFNAIVAPMLFDRLVEYPLGLAAACLLIPWPERRRSPWSRYLDIGLPLALGLFTYQWLDGSPTLPLWVRVAVPLLMCTAFYRHSSRLALGIAVIYVTSALFADDRSEVLYRTRNFFGQLRVLGSSDGASHRLVHGTTVHGFQATNPPLRGEPLGYYHRTGPVGQLFAAFEGPKRAERVALVGLGIGSLAAYGERGQRFDFFEINPEVERIARNPDYFHHLEDSRAEVRVVLGDARLMLAREPDATYKVIVIDAFGSGAVPVHLLTREAMALYRRKLAPGGMIAFHISNPFVRLNLVLGRLAAAEHLAARELDETTSNMPDPNLNHGKLLSHWVVVAENDADFGLIAKDPRWKALAPSPGAPWTDDRSDLLNVIRWK